MTHHWKKSFNYLTSYLTSCFRSFGDTRDWGSVQSMCCGTQPLCLRTVQVSSGPGYCCHKKLYGYSEGCMDTLGELGFTAHEILCCRLWTHLPFLENSESNHSSYNFSTQCRKLCINTWEVVAPCQENPSSVILDISVFALDSNCFVYSAGIQRKNSMTFGLNLPQGEVRRRRKVVRDPNSWFAAMSLWLCFKSQNS